MPSGIFDTSLFIKLGSIIGVCVSVPLITKSLSSRGGEPVSPVEPEIITVTEIGEKIGPIFNCETNEKNYKVYLLFDQKGLDEKKITSDNFFLQVVERENLKGTEKFVWGPGVKGEDKWSKWEIQVLPDETANILLQDPEKRSQNFGGTAVCSKQASKVYPWRDTNYKQFLRVEGGKEIEKTDFHIKLETCKEKGNVKECDVRISDQGPFSWNKFQPKVTISLTTK